MPDLSQLCADLAAEHAALGSIVADLDEKGWATPTPALPWTVRDQISHLAFFDEQATTACTDPEAFNAGLAAAAADIPAFVDGPLERGRRSSPEEAMGWWQDARRELLDAFATLEGDERIPWFGPSMSPASFISARLMETWAHGQDVADALGVTRPATDRLRHVAHIGVRARPFSYVANGRAAPDVPVRVELFGPSGDTWTWGPEDAADVVSGSALSFCLVVTQRRHPADTDLETVGDAARGWIEIAQCFAGPPGDGRRPGQFEPVGAPRAED